MDYNEIFTIRLYMMLFILLVVFLGIIILNTKLDIILYSDINNSNISVKLNIKYMFSFIDINKQIYPQKIKKEKKRAKPHKEIKKKKQKKGNNNIKISPYQIQKIYKLIRKIDINELYSKIEFGTDYIQITSFIYVLINCIYGFLANYLNPKKMYLGIHPDYTKNYLIGNFKIHIKPTVRELVYIGIELIKIFIKSKLNTKGGQKHEGNRINSKLNGNNA